MRLERAKQSCDAGEKCEKFVTRTALCFHTAKGLHIKLKGRHSLATYKHTEDKALLCIYIGGM